MCLFAISLPLTQQSRAIPLLSLRAFVAYDRMKPSIDTVLQRAIDSALKKHKHTKLHAIFEVQRRRNKPSGTAFTVGPLYNRLHRF